MKNAIKKVNGDKKKAGELYDKAVSDFPDSSLLKEFVKKEMDKMK